jgi:hypothetical protein
MAEAPLSFWDYVKQAVLRPVRSRALGALPLTQMLLAGFGLAGLFNPGFWLLGLALLVSLVGGRSSSERFQKLVRAELLAAQRSAQSEGTSDRLGRLYRVLEPASQARYRALFDQCREILGISGRGSGPESLTDLRAGSLNQLLLLFLRLLSSRELIGAMLKRVDRSALEQELASLRGRLAAAEADGPLARSLQATLDIQEQRLANLATASGNLDLIDAELERIEQQVRLVREESAVSGGPEMLSGRLDAVSSSLRETSRWMDQHADLFSDLASSEIDSPALPRLPELPAPLQAASPASPPPPPPRKQARER